MDPAIGVYIIDRYTYYALDFLEKVTPDSKKTMAQFVRPSPVFFFVFFLWDGEEGCGSAASIKI